MTSTVLRQNLLDCDRPALQQLMQDWGEPSFRVDQLIQSLHRDGITDIAALSNFSKALRQKLAAAYEVRPLEVIWHKVSADGTQKWLCQLPDGNRVDTVFIPQGNRGTLCVSSQVGCALNCSFCATGKQGFSRNLTVAEIIGQLWLAVRALSANKGRHDQKVTNVVMMGMGEPLYNFEAVVAAMNLMLDDHAYGLSKYRVTLSTSGVVPAMEKLRLLSPVSLAVSLHAPDNELRDEIVPLNRKYPLEQLIPLCRHYFPAESKRMVTFEYVMLAGVNDSLKQAKALARLLADVPCKINLIPFNPFPGTDYQCSSLAVIQAFQQLLQRHGFITTIRATRGDPIDAACGQLVGDFADRTGRKARLQRQRQAKEGLAEKQEQAS